MRDSRGRGIGVGDLSLDRRRFLRGAVGGSAALLSWPLWGPASRAHAAHHESHGKGLGAKLERALDASDFVYVSPLKSNGQESTCHGEVWYGWLDGHVVLITAHDRWKSRSVKSGLDRARIWVGNHGRWKGRVYGTNEGFRKAPQFEAKASFSKDEALLERLLALYEKKYPAEIASWRDRMRGGFHDGSRVLIRYAPQPSAPAKAPLRL